MQSYDEHRDADANEWKHKRDSKDDAARSEHALPQRKLPKGCFRWKIVNAHFERAGMQTCDEHEDANGNDWNQKRDPYDEAARSEHTLRKGCFGWKIVNVHFANTIQQ